MAPSMDFLGDEAENPSEIVSWGFNADPARAAAENKGFPEPGRQRTVRKTDAITERQGLLSSPDPIDSRGGLEAAGVKKKARPSPTRPAFSIASKAADGGKGELKHEASPAWNTRFEAEGVRVAADETIT